MFSAAVSLSRFTPRNHFTFASCSLQHQVFWPLPYCLTLCDLFPGSVEVIAGGNLSDHNQHAIVSVLELSAVLSMVLNRLLCSRHWGSCCDGDFHGNSAASGRWALFHLHDNCIRSEHHDGAGWDGRIGGCGSLDGGYLIGSQVIWLFDVTAYDWTRGKRGIWEFMVINFPIWHCWSTLSLIMRKTARRWRYYFHWQLLKDYFPKVSKCFKITKDKQWSYILKCVHATSVKL